MKKQLLILAASVSTLAAADPARDSSHDTQYDGSSIDYTSSDSCESPGEAIFVTLKNTHGMGVGAFAEEIMAKGPDEKKKVLEILLQKTLEERNSFFVNIYVQCIIKHFGPSAQDDILCILLTKPRDPLIAKPIMDILEKYEGDIQGLKYFLREALSQYSDCLDILFLQQMKLSSNSLVL